MIKLPPKLNIANLPTKIEHLDRLTKELGGPQLFIKRDDQTGMEVSGNKVRKMEYIVKEALDQNCDVLITCGGIQSNHARSTAAIAAKMGIKASLVLRGSDDNPLEGNYFLDKLLGADVLTISYDDYKHRRMEIMEEVATNLRKKGHKPYIIPEGGSMGIGTFGYYEALQEINKQEKEMGIRFDAIVLAVGSGGTFSGLFLANKNFGNPYQLYGVNVCDDATYFKNQISDVLMDSFRYLDREISFNKDEIQIIDGYVGRGYALSQKEELDFIHHFAKLEGIILDPVYTGKGMYGLVNEIKKGTFKDCQNILFIHTGGLYGVFPSSMQFTL